MKNIVEYIVESKSSNKDDLIKAIKSTKVGDTIDYLYGVTEVATKPADFGVYVANTIISLYKVNDTKFVPVSSIVFNGHDMIKAACKDEGWPKLRRILDFSVLLDEDQVIKLIDILPKYFSEYISKKTYVKALTFSYDAACKAAADMSKPYKIKSLANEISNIEAQIKTLEDKRKQLEDLKNIKDK